MFLAEATEGPAQELGIELALKVPEGQREQAVSKDQGSANTAREPERAATYLVGSVEHSHSLCVATSPEHSCEDVTETPCGL